MAETLCLKSSILLVLMYIAVMSDQTSNSLQAAQLAAATAQLSSTARGVQVQVLSSQAQTSTNGASVPSAAATSALLTTGSGQEVSATLASQLGAFRLPADQQKQLLLAHLQQLKSTTLPASILLQPAAVPSGAQLQGLTVVTTTPPTTTTTAKGWVVWYSRWVRRLLVSCMFLIHPCMLHIS